MISIQKKGFTLVELIVTLAVLAIMTSIALPYFHETMAKQEIKNIEKSIKQMNKAQAELRKFVSSFKIGLSRENEE